jgi:hypothetical protein
LCLARGILSYTDPELKAEHIVALSGGHMVKTASLRRVKIRRRMFLYECHCLPLSKLRLGVCHISVDTVLPLDMW